VPSRSVARGALAPLIRASFRSPAPSVIATSALPLVMPDAAQVAEMMARLKERGFLQ